MTDSFCLRRELIYQLQLGTAMPYRQQEESISSLERSAKWLLELAAGPPEEFAPVPRSPLDADTRRHLKVPWKPS
jgi:hypothetical protein